jgi:hypothetical protein
MVAFAEGHGVAIVQVEQMCARPRKGDDDDDDDDDDDGGDDGGDGGDNDDGNDDDDDDRDRDDYDNDYEDNITDDYADRQINESGVGLSGGRTDESEEQQKKMISLDSYVLAGKPAPSIGTIQKQKTRKRLRKGRKMKQWSVKGATKYQGRDQHTVSLVPLFSPSCPCQAAPIISCSFQRTKIQRHQH